MKEFTANQRVNWVTEFRTFKFITLSEPYKDNDGIEVIDARFLYGERKHALPTDSLEPEK